MNQLGDVAMLRMMDRGKTLSILKVLVLALTLMVCAQLTKPEVVKADASWSTFFSSASIEPGGTYNTPGSDGDLWPSAWSNDDRVYTLNGDGKGFGSTAYDIVSNVITGGDPYNRNIVGSYLTSNVSQVWSGSGYNRKPTGVISIGGVLYAAVQDLSFDFNSAPAATIVKSTDKGVTWTWASTPMFSGGVFTTIWFADYGKDSVHAPADGYIYAYGLDNNWRAQINVYLARVQKTSIMTRSKWEFYTGDLSGNASWSTDISKRKPVLHQSEPKNKVGQGGTVYNAPKARYIMSTWGGFANMTNLFESANPWGPFRQFLAYDAGPTDGNGKWPAHRNGGYGQNIPSKYISADGNTMWIQMNNWEPIWLYYYALRKIVLDPPNLVQDPGLENQTSNTAKNPWVVTGNGGIDRGLGFAYTGSNNAWVRNTTGYNTISQYVPVKPWTSYVFSAYVRTSSNNFDGFLAVDTTGSNQPARQIASVTFGSVPSYTLKQFYFNSGPSTSVQIFGGMLSNGEDIWVQFDDFKLTEGGTVPAPLPTIWDRGFEGTSGLGTNPEHYWYLTGSGGIDTGGFSHTGSRNAWVRSDNIYSWNAVKQLIQVKQFTNYTIKAYVRTSSNNTNGYFGVRAGYNGPILGTETRFGAYAGYTQISSTFNTGFYRTVDLYVGMWPNGGDTWVQIDDVSIHH
jgi:hypothetical protein